MHFSNLQGMSLDTTRKPAFPQLLSDVSDPQKYVPIRERYIGHVVDRSCVEEIEELIDNPLEFTYGYEQVSGRSENKNLANQVRIGGVLVLGQSIDAQTRCDHYHGPTDIVAIRFKCCGNWFSCYFCHRELTNHESTVWELSETKTEAIICGSCGARLTISSYLNAEDQCPHCKADFNPGCHLHHHLYFAMKP